MSNSYNISMAPKVAAVQAAVDANALVTTNIHDVDLPAVGEIGIANGVIITNIHDVDLPAVKTDTGNIRSVDVPDIKNEINTCFPDIIYEITADELHTNDDEVSTQSTNYIKKKEIWSPLGDDISIYFGIKNSGNGIAYGRIYINEVEQGTERTNSLAGTWEYHTETITVAKGDLIQLYIKISDESYTAFAEKLRVLGKVTRKFENKM